jgi:hypothetical protein
MIAIYDDRDKLWEEDINWQEFGAHDIDDDEWRFNKMNVLILRSLRKLTDFALVGRRHFVNPNVEAVEDGFHDLRRKLITHYNYKRVHLPHELEWLN